MHPPIEVYRHHVAPHRGAWIETGIEEALSKERLGRTPQGCVYSSTNEMGEKIKKANS